MASITTDGSTTAGTSVAQTLTSVFELGTARQIAYGATSANIALTTTCRFVTILAAGGTHIHYQIGVGAQTATSTTHYLAVGQRMTFSVPPNSNIAVIQGSAAGTLYISELTQ
jgi:hypothetical protein